MNAVFVDIDTQLDFLYPAGALYVPKAERIVPAVAQLNRFAARNGIPIISTTDAHTENDPEFHSWPPHCVAGTTGQHKADATLVERRVVVPNREGELPPLDGAQQIVIEKQTVDAFQTRTLGRIVARMNADRFVVYGVVTEICVYHAVSGLLAAGKRVVVVTDAVETLEAGNSKAALQKMLAGGAMLAPLSEVCGE
jgi:nicotinamidase/pyrazinamidase